MSREINIAVFAINDDVLNLSILAKSLETNGIYNYTLFTDPAELIEALHKDVHICVIDYYLRGGDYTGIQLIKEIVKANPYCFFIMISEQSDLQVMIDFTNNQYGGRYIKKGDNNATEMIIKYVKELTTHIHYLQGFYTHIGNIKDKLKEIKELITR